MNLKSAHPHTVCYIELCVKKVLLSNHTIINRLFRPGCFLHWLSYDYLRVEIYKLGEAKIWHPYSAFKTLPLYCKAFHLTPPKYHNLTTRPTLADHVHSTLLVCYGSVMHSRERKKVFAPSFWINEIIISEILRYIFMKNNLLSHGRSRNRTPCSTHSFF